MNTRHFDYPSLPEKYVRWIQEFTPLDTYIDSAMEIGSGVLHNPGFLVYCIGMWWENIDPINWVCGEGLLHR